MNRVIVAIALIIGLTSLLAACGESTPPMTAYYQVGQLAKTSQEIMTVVKAERVNRYMRCGLGAIISMNVDAPPITDFILIEVSVINVGDSPISIRPKDFTLKDSEGREYTIAPYEGCDKYPSTKVAPGKTGYGKIVFLVPEIATGLEAYCVLYGTAPVQAVWVLTY